jgi:uncharacterized protein YecE (DUF72 family)
LTRRNVVEFPNRSWWNSKVYAAFEEAGVIFCYDSEPRLPDELVTTTDEVYIRFHGLTKWYWHDISARGIGDLGETHQSERLQTHLGLFQ